jgi:hypothetical protein
MWQVDCTTSISFSQEFGITSLPAIRVFRDGGLDEYFGPTDDPVKAAAYIAEDALPAVIRLDEQQAHRAASDKKSKYAKKLRVFGYFPDQVFDETDEGLDAFSYDPLSQFETAAHHLRGYCH